MKRRLARPITLLAAMPLALGAQVLPTWTVAREVTIEVPAQSLAFGSVKIDTGGRIYVLRNDDRHNVHVFSPDGALIRTIGLNGEGGGLGFVGDSLWVGLSKQRVSVFPPDGKKPRTMSVPEIKVPKGAAWGAPSFLYQHLTSVLPGGASLLTLKNVWDMAPYAPPATALVRVAPKKPPVLVANRVLTHDERILSIVARRGGGACNLSVPFASHSVEDIADDGSAIVFVRAMLDGDSAGFARVTMIRATGDTAYSSRIPVTLKPIPQAVIDSAYATENLRGSCINFTQDNLDRIAIDSMKRMPRPTVYPPTATVDVGRDGWVLVGFAPSPQDREHMLLDPTGRPAARIVLPRTAMPLHLDRDHIWAGDRDANGVQRIVRYRIVRG